MFSRPPGNHLNFIYWSNYMNTVRLQAGQLLTITADANSSGTYWRLTDTDNATLGSPVAITASSTATAGPFNVNSKWALDSTLGTLTFTKTEVHYTSLEAGGTVPLTADWDAGPHEIRAETFQSDVATGTAPFTVASATMTDNLNADMVDGVEAAAINQLGVAQESTKQHNFNASTLTALGTDSVTNGVFTDGADFAVNGSFTGDTDWTKGTGWTLPGTVATSDGSQTGDSDLENTGVAVVAGQVYSVVFTVSGYSAGNVTAVAGSQEGTDRGSDATFTELITATDTGVLMLRADVDFIGSVDNVTIALVGDAGWTQGDGWLISAGTASSDGTQSADADLEDDGNAPVAGNAYEVVFTVSGYSAGNVTAVVGNQEGTDRGSDATFTELIVATNTDVLKIRADATFVGSVDAITMKLANVSWDLDDNQVTTITADQNVVMDDPTNMKDGGIYVLHIIQDATGTRIPTWGSAFLWEGGSPPTLTTTATSGHDILTFTSDGTSMFLASETLDLG
jgi:hypothetical protein